MIRGLNPQQAFPSIYIYTVYFLMIAGMYYGISVDFYEDWNALEKNRLTLNFMPHYCYVLWIIMYHAQSKFMTCKLYLFNLNRKFYL